MSIEPAVHPGGFPYARLFVVAGVAVAIFQIVALVVAFRRRAKEPLESAPSLRLQGAAGAAVIVLFAIGGGAVHAARHIVTDAFALYRAPWDAGYGIVAQVNAFPIVTRVCAVVLLLWLAGLKLTLDARERARSGSKQSPTSPPVALVGLGLLPMLAGIWSWCGIMADAFGATVGVSQQRFNQLLQEGMAAARARLESANRISVAAIVSLAAVACMLVVLRRRKQGDDAGDRAPRASILASAGALVAAAILFVAARPMRIENITPWPPDRNEPYAWIEGSAPDLPGPDAPEASAPVVRLGYAEQEMELDGRRIAPGDLVDALWKMRSEFTRRHPDGFVRDFDGAVVAVVSADAAHPRVVSMLRAMHDAGYTYPVFAFRQHETHARPKLGGFHRAYAGGARVNLIDASDKMFADDDPTAGRPGALVSLSDFRSTFDDLARKVVELRRSGRPVVIDLDRLR